MQKTLLALLGVSSSMFAAQNQDRCAPEPGATCYPDDCKSCYCLGPENTLANAPVCPYTCDGDISITVAGFYWTAHQDGMEFAINNAVRNDVAEASTTQEVTNSVERFTNLVDAEYVSPSSKWDFGFRFGLAYCNPCDGWDFGVYWTWFQPRAHKHIEAEESDCQVLLPLWSNFASTTGGTLFATDIEAKWKLDLNIIDLELGRNFWTSKYLSVRPHIGLRVAFLDQDYNLEHRGGSFGPNPTPVTLIQNPVNDFVKMDNKFYGVGVRGGLNTNWHLGCGWALYGESAASIVYGRFKVRHSETLRECDGNHEKIRVLDLDDSFRASRAMLDLGLGVQWMGMICDCKYGFLISLGWEQHLFFHQNQLWRTVRIGDPILPTTQNKGENVYHQRRGNLDTQGVTLRIKFDF